eukprot:m.19211 g.19211  ORF g.19211 m.19211 type:complete len:127 (+) comp7997_c0_seq1:380-760(+)
MPEHQQNSSTIVEWVPSLSVYKLPCAFSASMRHADLGSRLMEWMVERSSRYQSDPIAIATDATMKYPSRGFSQSSPGTSPSHCSSIPTNFILRVLGQIAPKLVIVFNNVMYVPPTAGSLIWQKNCI